MIPLIKKENKIFRLKSFELKRIPVQTKSAVAETIQLEKRIGIEKWQMAKNKYFRKRIL